MVVPKLIEKLRNSKFFLAVMKVGTGQLIGQAFALITMPLLSRIYSETAYGDQAIIISTAAIIINLSTLGLNSAIMKPSDDNEAKTIFTTALLANVIISTLFVLGCVLLSKRVMFFSISGSYTFALLLMWLYMVLQAASSLEMVYTNRKGKYNKLFFNPIIGSIVNIVIAVPLGLMGIGYQGFIITSIIGYAIMYIHMAWRDSPIIRAYKLSDFLRVLKEYKEYVLFQYPSNFFNNTAIEYPTQFLGRNFSSYELGGYSMCLRVLKYPVRLIAAPISTVYFRTSTEYRREDKDLAGFTYKMIIRIFLISFIPILVFIIFSRQLFCLVLGEKWAAAGEIAAWLSVQYVMMFCSQCTSYCRVTIDKQKSNLLFSVVYLLTLITTCALGYWLFNSLTGTIAFLSIGQCLCYMFDMGLNFYYMNRKYLIKYLIISSIYIILMYIILLIKKNI